MTVNKVRRNGSYAPLSAHYYKDDAIDEAGEAAELLYVRGLAFCADVLSDGFISDRQLVRFVGVGMTDAVDRATTLVKVGLWRRAEGGYEVTAWLKWNRSKGEIADAMAKDNQRKGSSRGSSAPPSDSDDPPPDPPNGGGRPDDRIPEGFRSDSVRTPDGSPDGIQPRARTPLHSTPLQEELLVIADATTDPAAGFDDFWPLYPRKVKKQDARNAWIKHVVKARVPVEIVMTALRAHIIVWQAHPQFPQFVPHPTTWINGGRWLDEIDERPVRVVPDPPALPTLTDLVTRRDAATAARILGEPYLPKAQPPSDPTPPQEWARRQAESWFAANADRLAAVLSEKASA